MLARNVKVHPKWKRPNSDRVCGLGASFDKRIQIYTEVGGNEMQYLEFHKCHATSNVTSITYAIAYNLLRDSNVCI